MIRAIPTICLCCVALAAGCSPPSNNTPADAGDDADGADAARDADGVDEPLDEPGACHESADCDDRIDCTQDVCGVGGTCRNIPLNDLCPGEEVCRPGVGCELFQCDEHADCDDGVFCNGAERCIGSTCYDGEARDCDDGNDCTEDSCNVMTDSCAHEPLPGCVPTDGGTDGGVGPFDPEVHYSGSFRIFPARISDCGEATFNISSISMTSTADELRVTAGRFTLIQTPRPTDEHFSVASAGDGCGTYSLSGTFTNENTFTGDWIADFAGRCGHCGDQFDEVTGVRQ